MLLNNKLHFRITHSYQYQLIKFTYANNSNKQHIAIVTVNYCKYLEECITLCKFKLFLFTVDHF